MTKDEALKLALDALEAAYARIVTKCEQNLVTYNGVDVDTLTLSQEAITAIKEALAQPEQEQEPVAWRYKPVREDNPWWEYTTNHPLDMGDGYLRPLLVEYCKCIEPLYAKEKPKLMLEKFREIKDLLDDTTPPQRTWVGLTDIDYAGLPLEQVGLVRWAEAKLKEKNT